MTRAGVVCGILAVLLIINLSFSNAATRVARSPQFGFSQASANAQAYGGGPGFGYRPGGYGGRGGHFRRGFGKPGFGGGFGNGGSFSVSKSFSISRGGVAGSSASSIAGGK